MHLVPGSVCAVQQISQPNESNYPKSGSFVCDTAFYLSVFTILLLIVGFEYS